MQEVEDEKIPAPKITDDSFALSPKGSTSCPSGYAPITSETECKDAANALEAPGRPFPVTYWGERSSFLDCAPRGCRLQDEGNCAEGWGNNLLTVNFKPAHLSKGSSHPSTWSICVKEKTESPTESPTPQPTHTKSPTQAPTGAPTSSAPTPQPTDKPTQDPSFCGLNLQKGRKCPEGCQCKNRACRVCIYVKESSACSNLGTQRECRGDESCSWLKREQRCVGNNEQISKPPTPAKHTCSDLGTKRECRGDESCSWLKREQRCAENNDQISKPPTSTKTCQAQTKKSNCKKIKSCRWKRGSCIDR